MLTAGGVMFSASRALVQAELHVHPHRTSKLCSWSIEFWFTAAFMASRGRLPRFRSELHPLPDVAAVEGNVIGRRPYRLILP